MIPRPSLGSTPQADSNNPLAVNQVYFERQVDQSSIDSRGDSVSSYSRSDNQASAFKRKWFEVSARNRISSNGSDEEAASDSSIYKRSQMSKRSFTKDEEESKGSGPDRRLLKESVQLKKESKDFYCSRQSLDPKNYMSPA